MAKPAAARQSAADRRMSIRGNLFDKDGTLLDFNSTWVPLYRAAAVMVARGDVTLAAKLLHAGGQDDAAGTVAPGSLLAATGTAEIAACWAEIAPDHGFDDLIAALDELFQREITRCAAPVKGLTETMAGLKKRGFVMGVATSDGEASAAASLAPFGVLEYFDFIAGYDSGHGIKPGPGMAHGFCTATGLTPGEIMVVGDNRHDMEMGRAAGAGICVGVLSGTSALEHLSDLADHVIDSIVDIKGLLQGNSDG